MNICLDLDIGNSRVKWRFGTRQGIESGARLPDVGPSVGRVRICSVKEGHDELSRECKRVFGLEPEFAVATKSLCGVTSAYEDPSKLGTDRWLAMCAAWNLRRHACIVIDAGTALTIDVVAESGQHLGGYIVPGLATMQRHLWDTTEQVKVSTEESAKTDVYGNNTKSCVANGTLKMCSEFINGVLRAPGVANPAVFLTGGDVQSILPHIDAEVRLEPYLVLDGLALALP